MVLSSVPANTTTIVAVKADANTTALYPIDAYGTCRYIQNLSPSNAYFVPFRTSVEWQAFIAATITGSLKGIVTLTPCVRPVTTAGNVQSITLSPDATCGSPTPASATATVVLPYARYPAANLSASASFTCVTTGLCNAKNECGKDQTWRQTVTASYQGGSASDSAPAPYSSTWTSLPWTYSGSAPVPNQAPLDGVCGTANGTTVSSAPTGTAALCSAGTVSSVSGSGPWSWSCAGNTGGQTASCNTVQTSVVVNDPLKGCTPSTSGKYPDNIAGGNGITYTAGSHTFTVPEGVTTLYYKLRGGGASGALQFSHILGQTSGPGGGSGYLAVGNVSVTSGQRVSLSVGHGGGPGNTTGFAAAPGNGGGGTTLKVNNTKIDSASGGHASSGRWGDGGVGAYNGSGGENRGFPYFAGGGGGTSSAGTLLMGGNGQNGYVSAGKGYSDSNPFFQGAWHYVQSYASGGGGDLGNGVGSAGGLGGGGGGGAWNNGTVPFSNQYAPGGDGCATLSWPAPTYAWGDWAACTMANTQTRTCNGTDGSTNNDAALCGGGATSQACLLPSCDMSLGISGSAGLGCDINGNCNMAYYSCTQGACIDTVGICGSVGSTYSSVQCSSQIGGGGNSVGQGGVGGTNYSASSACWACGPICQSQILGGLTVTTYH